jgi:hypothetical protein
MEADWEIELGDGAPVIDAGWAGLMDLRRFPERAGEIAETQLLPGLAEALVRLNSPGSPFWTAKCDVWLVEEPVDPYELDAEVAEAARAVACYVDLLPRDALQWGAPESAAVACRTLVERLRAVPLSACRADLVVRHARIVPESDVLGVTAYLTACGADEARARLRLAEAMAAFAGTLAPAGVPARGGSPLQ